MMPVAPSLSTSVGDGLYPRGRARMTTSQPFRRNIFHDYPVRLLPEDLRAEFEEHQLVRVTVEALRGIKSGDMFVEIVFGYGDEGVGQRSETTLVWP
jgi:hypothetical protein